MLIKSSLFKMFGEKRRQLVEIGKWSTHVEFVVVFITLLGGLYALDAKFERLDARIDQQSARTDRLYEMFIDLVREVKR